MSDPDITTGHHPDLPFDVEIVTIAPVTDYDWRPLAEAPGRTCPECEGTGWACQPPRCQHPQHVKCPWCKGSGDDHHPAVFEPVLVEDDLIARIRYVLYQLEDENAITCRNRQNVAERIVREVCSDEGDS